MDKAKLNELKALLDQADQIITDLFDEDPKLIPGHWEEIAPAFRYDLDRLLQLFLAI